MGAGMRSKLTYSNIVATVALFLALGGVSYAAVTLAPNSVGTSQLRSGSVTGSKLAFPLGIATSEDAGPVTLSTSSCSPQTACPAVANASPLTSASLNLTKASRVLLIGSGEFNLSSPNAAASVRLGLQAGPTSLPTGFQPVTSTSATTVSVQRVVSLPAGSQTVSLTAEASGTSISGEHLQVTAIVLPGMPAGGQRRSTESPTPVPRS
jgi:hypothetical protein